MRKSARLLMTMALVAAIVPIGASAAPTRHAAAISTLTPTLVINDVFVTEPATGSSTSAIFTVTLSGESSEIVSVDFTTANGTATVADADYEAESGTLAFLPGAALTQQVLVTVNGDNNPENPDEDFDVNLSNPANATLGPQPQGTAIIEDDVASPKLSINDISVDEADATSPAIFTLTLSKASAADVVVSMTTSDLTADAGQDYTAKTQDITFPAGIRTATFTVNVTGDNVDEITQNFAATMTQVQGGGTSIGDPDAYGIARIRDDEAAPTVSVNDVTLREGDAGRKRARFAVTLSHPTEKGITVRVRTTDGSAKFADGDYHRIPAEPISSVAFNENETSMPVGVPVVGDLRLEGRESFNLVLSRPTNATIDDGQGKGFIRNNDIALTVAVTKRASSVRAGGFLKPAHPGDEIVVRYYRRTASGTWSLLGTKTPVLSAAQDFNGDGSMESRYSTSFARTSGSRCKMTARFQGDGDHRAGRATEIFNC
jgi:Calx-beta domain